MANLEHFQLLNQGVKAWNRWRKLNRDVRIDLREADLGGHDLNKADLSEIDLSGADLNSASLSGANLSGARLTGADLGSADLVGASLAGASLTGAVLSGAYLSETDFSESDLSGADLQEADLGESDLSSAMLTDADLSRAFLNSANLTDANLTGATLEDASLTEADLTRARLTGATLTGADLTDTKLHDAHLHNADLSSANLTRADLFGADLTDADLHHALLLNTDLTKARLNGCNVNGIVLWDATLLDCDQTNLVIDEENEPTIIVDDLEIARFIALLMHNDRVRGLVDTFGKQAVLIIGRSTGQSGDPLDTVRDALKKQSLMPILLRIDDEQGSKAPDTAGILARLSRYVIADLGTPDQFPLELLGFVPETPWIPLQPLVSGGNVAHPVFDQMAAFSWVLPPLELDPKNVAGVVAAAIRAAEDKLAQLRGSS